jgi:chemotaxis protein MotB
MKITVLIPALFIIGAMAQGCVSSKKYKELQNSYNKLDSNTRDLRGQYLLTQRNLEKATDRVTSLEEQLASERSNNKSLQAALDKCLNSSSQGNVNISKLVDEINRSNKYIQQAY